MIRLLTSLALGSTALAGMAHAQSTPQPSPFPPVPITKVLAVGHLSGPMNAETRKAIMPKEVNQTVQLYLNGKIDQWYVRKDQNGVVFVMNVATVAEAHALLEALPLGKAKIMEFELIPLGPLSPLYLLLDPAAKPTKDTGK